MEISKLPPEENIGVVINAIIGVFLGVGLILVCLRIFVRTKINKAFGWDDTLIILALVRYVISSDHCMLTKSTDSSIHSLGYRLSIGALRHRATHFLPRANTADTSREMGDNQPTAMGHLHYVH